VHGSPFASRVDNVTSDNSKEQVDIRESYRVLKIEVFNNLLLSAM